MAPADALDDRRRDVHRPMPRQQQTGHAGGVTVADDRAEVARIGHAVDGDEERFGLAVAPDQVTEVGLGYLGGVRQHSLRRIGARLVFELALRDVAQRNTRAPRRSRRCPPRRRHPRVRRSPRSRGSCGARAISSSRTAWRPSTWRPPSPFAPDAAPDGAPVRWPTRWLDPDSTTVAAADRRPARTSARGRGADDRPLDATDGRAARRALLTGSALPDSALPWLPEPLPSRSLACPVPDGRLMWAPSVPRRMRAVAKHRMPSPRPIAPNRSARLPLIDTGAPTAR